MSTKPIFVATHPRACSTAFERVFMTRRDTLDCIHEPFGDAFYFGPERLSERYADDEEARIKSGFSNITYRDVMDDILSRVGTQKKRLFIKDIAHYLFPLDGKPAEIAPSLIDYVPPNTTNGSVPNGTNGTSTTTTNGSSPSQGAIKSHHTTTANPTVIPSHLFSHFHFTFLIRHPRRAIPSYYRCTVPPLSSKTGFHNFLPSEAGYDELARLVKFLLQEGQVTPENITVVDADDLLDNPEGVIRKFCAAVGLAYDPAMLKWGEAEDGEGQKRAQEAFEKWNGFHDDALGSSGLRPRVGGAKKRTEEEEDAEWRDKFGEEGRRVIRECVNANVEAYEFLRGFKMEV